MATRQGKTSKKSGGAQQPPLFESTRHVPTMPEGYYSGDQPNANLPAFVAARLAAHPYDLARDDYAVPAFDQPIETTKATAIYNMHTYWSKKPHDAIRQYIRHYTQPGDLILDPFCGSGGTALAALMEGRAAIAIDRSPAATFITKNYCTPVDVDALQAAFAELQARVKSELDWLYATRCDRCDGPAIAIYTLNSGVYECPRCLNQVPLFDCIEVKGQTVAGAPKIIRVCPHCLQNDIQEEVSVRNRKCGVLPVLTRYECLGTCKPARSERTHNDPDPQKQVFFHQYDLAKLAAIAEKPIPYWYPENRMMNSEAHQERWGLLWRPYLTGIETVADLFTKRNLWALAIIANQIRSQSRFQDIFWFTFTSMVLKSSRMMVHNSDGIGRIQKGTYFISQIQHDINVSQFFIEAFSDMVDGYRTLQIETQECIISTQDARRLNISESAIDYIFTDPPYAEKVQYGELNFVWEAWLRFDTHWQDEEIIVNEIRGKGEADWANMMKQAMTECYRVLKPGHWLSLCYHDSSEGTWAAIQDLMAEVGFIADASESALYIDAAQKSLKQRTSDKITMRDLVINFRKPRPGETRAELTISGEEDARTFGEKARAIIRDYLTANPGATKDRIYDALVSHMVRSGSMEAHDFDALLGQVAEEVSDSHQKHTSSGAMAMVYVPGQPYMANEMRRWYLKETADVADEAEMAREDAAARQLSVYMTDWLRQNPTHEGVHYSDLFERYIYTTREKPRRSLQDWLPDYYYKTDDGGWRPPASEEETVAKAQGRANGASRRIKRYLSFLRNGLAIPAAERPGDATLVAWLRHCRRAGLYEQGKLLYEQGGLRLERLSEEAQVEAEEDYQVCLRRLTHKPEAASAKRDASRQKATKRRASATGQMRLELDS